MTSTITEAFTRAHKHGTKALIAYAVAGDPDIARSVKVFCAMADGGADVIEIGIAFSDPIADGPVIQSASGRALSAGTTLARVLNEVVPAVKGYAPNVPLIAMTYYNVILAMGEARFAQIAAERGLSGVIVPDLPIEQDAVLHTALGAQGLDLVPLCAPTTPKDRARAIAQRAQGFVYCVSIAGVTGARAALPDDLIARLDLLRSVANVPIAAGFGIATEAQARWLAPHTDGIVVGSAIVNAAHTRGPEGVRTLCQEIKRGLQS